MLTYPALRSGVIRARASFMSWRRVATLLANRVRAASLIWPWLSSAPPISASSRVVISNAYPESEAPTEIGEQRVQLRPGLCGEQALLGVQGGPDRRDLAVHLLPSVEHGRLGGR